MCGFVSPIPSEVELSDQAHVVIQFYAGCTCDLQTAPSSDGDELDPSHPGESSPAQTLLRGG